MKKELAIVGLIIGAIISISSTTGAYSKTVHVTITTHVIDQNMQSLNNYLKNIGFAPGTVQEINGKKISDWMKDGSWMEDVSPDLPTSHFYDPLTNKGYTVLGVEIGQSAYDRANDLTNYGPWRYARDTLHHGLTQIDNVTRSLSLSHAFEALGRAMHLVQDVAVPAHTRNDFHTADPYEAYTNRKVANLNYSSITFPSGYVSASTGAPKYFWDTDTYTGGSIPTSDSIGLAEYTNANFFSADTIFSSSYPHPTYADTTYATIDWLHPEVTDAEDGKFDNKIYIRKTVGEADARMASASYISRDCIKKGNIQYTPWVLDDGVYNDYAALLIPRAVGYSAGLLDYFFRGTIDITVPSNGIYSVIDAAQTGFTSIKLKATNTTTTGEDMTNGTLQLVVKYKVAQSDPFHSDPPPVSADFSYIVVPEKNNVTSLYSATPTELNFDLLGQNAIPLWATDVYLQVVFKGTLGNENGAVAVGLKDISEPTPIDIFNNMDKICISGQWYNAGSTEAYDALPSSAKWWDYWAHDLKDEYIRVSPVSNPSNASPTNSSFHTALIVPGTLYRVFILSDYDFYRSAYGSMAKKDANDNYNHSGTIKTSSAWAGAGVRNQEDYSTDLTFCADYGLAAPCTVRQTSYFYPFRGIELWGSAGYIVDGVTYPNNSPCPWDSLNQ